MSEANKALVRRMYSDFSSGNLSVVEELVADDFVDHEEIPGVPPTKEGVRQFFEMMTAAFENFQLVVEDMVAEGDKVVVRARMTGTHRGEFMGIPATGKNVDVPLIDVLRFAGGKLVEHWGVMDSGVMLTQLGVVEMPS